MTREQRELATELLKTMTVADVSSLLNRTTGSSRLSYDQVDILRRKLENRGAVLFQKRDERSPLAAVVDYSAARHGCFMLRRAIAKYHEARATDNQAQKNWAAIAALPENQNPIAIEKEAA